MCNVLGCVYCFLIDNDNFLVEVWVGIMWVFVVVEIIEFDEFFCVYIWFEDFVGVNVYWCKFKVDCGMGGIFFEIKLIELVFMG